MTEITRVRVACLRGRSLLVVDTGPAERRYWILPGGGIEPGETIEDAAVRELFEETGVRGSVVGRLSVPPGCPGIGAEYALVHVTTDAPTLASPHFDSAVSEWARVEWHDVTYDDPTAGMDPEYWAVLGPLLLRLANA